MVNRKRRVPDNHVPYEYVCSVIAEQAEDTFELIAETTGDELDRRFLDLNDSEVYEFLPHPDEGSATLMRGWMRWTGILPTNFAEVVEMCEQAVPELRGTPQVRQYAELGYVEEWLRLKYPAHFQAAGMSAAARGPYGIKWQLNSYSQSNVRVLPPSVNLSGASTTVIDGMVLLGLETVRALPPDSAEMILRERIANGEFASFDDFDLRVGLIDQGNGLFEQLVKSGALDSTGETRASMLQRAQSRYFGTDAAMARSARIEDRDVELVVHEFESLGGSVTYDLLQTEWANRSPASVTGVVWKVVDEPEPDGVPSRRVALITSEGLEAVQFLGESVARFNEFTAPLEFIRVVGVGAGWFGSSARKAAAAFTPENPLVRR